MPYSKIKGIIFDLGSTLIEYENKPWQDLLRDCYLHGYQETIRNGKNLPDFDTFYDRIMKIQDRRRKAARETLREYAAYEIPETLFIELGIKEPRKLAQAFVDGYFPLISKESSVETGALRTLKELQARGYKMGLISNTIFFPHNHDADLEKAGLLPYLRFRIYSSVFGWRKPQPEIFITALDQIRLAPEETAYVGDRYYEDVTGAEGVGIKPVLKVIKKREYPDPLPEKFPVITSLPQLLEIFKKSE